MKHLYYNIILIVIINIVSGQFDRQTYIIPTEPASDLASRCPDNSNTNRCMTLTEFIISTANSTKAIQSRKEIIFQSGLHIVRGLNAHGYNSSSFRITTRMPLTMRGESTNVTIVCLEQFFFEFVESNRINISNITFRNCVAHSSSNYTLVFNKLVGNVLLNCIQINNKFGAGISVYVMGNIVSGLKAQVNLTHSTIITPRTGIYVDDHFLRLDSTVAVYIENTYFIQSCLTFYHMDRDRLFDKSGGKYNVVLKNISVENSTCWSALSFRGSNNVKISLILQDVRMTNNRSPILIYANKTSLFRVTGCNLFRGNRGVMYLMDSLLFISQANVDFSNNVILTSHGVPILVGESQVVFENSFVTFESNKGVHCGGMIVKLKSQLIFKDNTTVYFKDNSGENGGALSLSDESFIKFTSSNHTLVKFQYNKAKRGGAIFVEDSGYINTFNRSLIKSLFELMDGDNENIKVQFTQNSAQIGGNDIYGGWVDFTVDKFGAITYNANISTILVSASNQISSDPVRACLCTNGLIDCTILKHEMVIFGHAFNLNIVAVGQRFAPVIEFVEASLEINNHDDRKIKDDHRIQTVQKNCTTLQYTLLFPSNEETVTIFPLRKEYSPRFDSTLLQQFSQYDLLFKQLSIKLRIKSCPLGFTLHNSDGSCICLSSIASLGLQCDIDYKIRREKRQWVGTDELHSIANEHPAIIAHQYCPYDYCRSDDDSLLIRLEDPDELCAFNRTGVLCGSCKTNLSRVFGSTRCKRCSNYMVLVITPIFLLSGLLLVIFLVLLNLTVSVGTINGLTFYANVIRAQHTTFFTAKASNSFLSLFISWLNLDQGIETCLYNGLDDYINTWFQYLFPLYIWLIAAALIVSSHYSIRISKIISNNAVPVLATLFLISYTKVLRSAIDVISFTIITYPDGYKKRVWLVDGNIEFLKGKHIPLFLVTVLFLLLSLPYTLILPTIQLIYKISHYHNIMMSWVQRLKPIIDAYTGPYKSSHRYWTGLLLVARIVLLITFSVHQENNLHINLIAITTVSVLLLCWISSFGWVYERQVNNYLEAVFLANIGITSAATSFNLVNKIESPLAINISVGVTFTILVFIILYHVQRQLLLTKPGLKFKNRFLTATSMTEHTEDDSNKREKSQSLVNRQRKITSTVLQPFDKTYKSNADELRESLLSC